jgi:hypothetical protein
MPKKLYESGPDMGGKDFGVKNPDSWERTRGSNREHWKQFLGTAEGKKYQGDLDAHMKKKHEAFESARKEMKDKHPKRV